MEAQISLPGSDRVSVLFSEPKIPQSCLTRVSVMRSIVSVLFSEPKIPQSCTGSRCSLARSGFQCSSASRKFLNWQHVGVSRVRDKVSVLFSEPKIPQSSSTRRGGAGSAKFQCSSASRKFLNLSGRVHPSLKIAFQCSSASRKFLNY